jgi:hypothetical protein
MKFQLLVAALFGVAMSQYNPGSTSGVNLPGTPSGTGDSSGNKVTLPNVVVPTFPGADILKLNGGSTNTQITNQNTFGTISGARK